MTYIHKVSRQQGSKTFFWGFYFLPKAKREAIYTVFAWVNYLDNLLASDLNSDEKKEILQAWQEELDNIFEKKAPQSDIGRKIYKNCFRFKLPKKDFLNILQATITNVQNPLQAPTLEELYQYCHNVGYMKGGIVLRVFGYNNENLINEFSNALGIAFKTTNILKYIKKDAQNDLLFIPKEMLEKAGITSNNPRDVVVHKNLFVAREELAKIALLSFDKVYSIIAKLDKKTAKYLLMMTNIQKQTFDMMQKRGWEVIAPQPKVSKFFKLKEFILTLLLR